MNEKQSSKWLPISICILTPFLLVAALIVWVGTYAHHHPNGMFSYLLFRNGIRCFEQSYTDRQEPQEFIGGFKSYQSIGEVKTILNAQNITGVWAYVDVKEAPEKGASRQSAKSFKIFGCEGDLTIYFFNNRLMRMTFYPHESDLFFVALENKSNLSFPIAQEVRFSSNIMAVHGDLRSGKDKTKRPFLMLYDDRLLKQHSAWELRYSKAYSSNE
ncbi:MAG: hypothetical protein JWQ04_2952 [Pedosphaera sp.]|nr:hypothetical protein [Pedosphaera sp.]